MSNVNMSVSKSIFEGNFGTYVFGKCMALAISPDERDKILKYLLCVEVCIFLKSEIYIWSSHFHEVISKNLLIGNDFFVLNTRLSVNKKCPNSLYFYWNLGSLLTFISPPLMISIIVHTRRPNTQQNVSYLLDFYVSANIHFSHFEELKSTFLHRSISLHDLCT